MRRRGIKKTKFYNKLRTGKYRSRKTQVSRYLSRDIVAYQCEAYDYLIIPGGGADYSFGSGNSYWNIRTVLSASQTFTGYSGLYSQYKITGISCRVSRNIAEARVNSNLSGFLPSPILSFSPTETSVSNGNLPAFHDSKQTIDPDGGSPQVKYWAFPDNFSNVGFGLGVWNTCIDYNQQLGQINVTQMNSLPTTATATAACFSIRVTVYVKFKDMKR